MNLPWQTSDLHPHALSLTEDALEVVDFADALAADLAAFNPPDTIHRYRIIAHRGEHETVLRANGFIATRLTTLTALPLTLVNHPMLDKPLPKALSAHWFTLKERAPWGGWIGAHWRHYQATHTSNPPREPVKGLRKIFVGEDFVEGLALRDGPQGRVRGFASLRDDQELGWIGGAGDLVAHLLVACLRRATALGWTTATIEVDDDDRDLWALVKALEIAPQQTFVTWQRERDPAKRPN